MQVALSAGGFGCRRRPLKMETTKYWGAPAPRLFRTAALAGALRALSVRAHPVKRPPHVEAHDVFRVQQRVAHIHLALALGLGGAVGERPGRGEAAAAVRCCLSCVMGLERGVMGEGRRRRDEREAGARGPVASVPAGAPRSHPRLLLAAPAELDVPCAVVHHQHALLARHRAARARSGGGAAERERRRASGRNGRRAAWVLLLTIGSHSPSN